MIIDKFYGKDWSKHKNTYFKGKFWYKNKLYKNDDAARLVSAKISLGNQWLKQIDGFFAIIHLNSDSVQMVCDRIRSIPIFYAITSTDFYFGDDIQSLKLKTNSKFNSESISEFLMGGIVMGEKTLLDNISQVEAGTTVIYDKATRNLGSSSYFDYYLPESNRKNRKSLISDWTIALENSIKRLIVYSADKKIVLPLSGGYDSRLIAIYLKKFGFENILCYSYGIKGNKESQVSKKVAEKLGLEWIFIETSENFWSEFYNKYFDDKTKFFLSSYTSCPHLQDWPVVFKLKEKGLIPKGSVFVPGHSGDFIGGSHIPLDLLSSYKSSKSKISSNIISNHFNLFNENGYEKVTKKSYEEFVNLCHRQISNSISKFVITESSSNASIYELWDWKERQSKFIVNSVKVYELFGFDWYLPLWDLEIMDVGLSVPLNLRYRTKLYSLICKEISERNIAYKPKYNDFTWSGIHEIMHKSNMIKAWWKFKEILIRLKSKEKFQNSPNVGWHGAIPKTLVEKHSSYWVNFYSFLCYDYLCSIGALERDGNDFERGEKLK